MTPQDSAARFSGLDLNSTGLQARADVGRSFLRPYLPALLLLLFSAGSGTFTGAARGSWTLAGHLALIAVVLAAGRDWRDPLRLTRGGNLLLAVLALSVVLSFYQSPVPRAGRLGLVLLPAFLLVPAFVERCWTDPAARRRGVMAVTAVVAAVAAWSLAAWWWLATPGASLPLGHHNLLAAWLLALAPLAVVPWRDGGGARWLAGAALTLAVAALAASRSLSGLAALAVVLTVTLGRRHRLWLAAAVAALAAIPGTWSRVADVVAGDDVSWLARQGYMEAAWRGFLERPLFGWGPGAAHWTLGRFLTPVPGVHPPGEVVADPHSWPLRIAYEHGLAGLLLGLAVAVVFLRARLSETPADPALRRAAYLALLGVAVISLAERPLAAPAVPLAALIGVGALLAAGPPRAAPAGRTPLLLAAAMALLLAPADLAHLAYDRAVDEPEAEAQARLLRRAVRLDPSFPLYRARLALLGDDAGGARRAALDASGVAHLWLLAGALQNGEDAGDALLKACALDPFAALAPLRLAAGAEDDPRAPQWMARALLAEPRLLAAPDLVEPLLAAAIQELRRVDGLPSGWVDALAVAHGRVARRRDGPLRRLALTMDGDGATALSLHSFRRWPWPAYLDAIPLYAEALLAIDLEAASRSRETEARVFTGRDCGLPDGGLPPR